MLSKMSSGGHLFMLRSSNSIQVLRYNCKSNCAGDSIVLYIFCNLRIKSLYPWHEHIIVIDVTHYIRFFFNILLICRINCTVGAHLNGAWHLCLYSGLLSLSGCSNSYDTKLGSHTHDVLPLAATETIVYGHRSSGNTNFWFLKMVWYSIDLWFSECFFFTKWQLKVW